VKRISPKLQHKAKKIKLLLLDVDGVLTDGSIFIDDRGYEIKRFDVRDGQGIALLQRAGIHVGFITGRSSNVLRHRARELAVKIVYQGVHDKAATYHRLKQKIRLADDQIAYVGDDIADLPILRKAGLSIAVQDAWRGIKSAVDYVTQARGGHGAIREVSELLLRAQNVWKELEKKHYFP
jgi:3-deoxy-D-manno-octulosonate 8-phosphate phosphatase (KDO 8-P phosphatase)